LNPTIVALAALLCAAPAGAQDYPTKPLNMVIPFPPGGNTDLMARALQPELAKALGQPVVVVNKGGAGGTIGDIEVANARPDGYTIGLTPNNPLTAQPHIQKLPYDMASFRYVCLTYDVPYVLIASPKAPFATFAEFMAFAKAKNDNLIYASPGPGTQPHLGILAVLSAIKAEACTYLYRRRTDVAGDARGHGDGDGEPPPSPRRAISRCSRRCQRRESRRCPTPTMAELGYPAEAFTAGGIVAPADRRRRGRAAAKACADAVASEGYKSASDKLNAIPRYLPEAEFKALFEADSVRNAEAVKKAGITQ
jgi:tripartite-type tricarboxylate transporter receptor subunit TctC